MNINIFKAYDIRGVYPEQINEDIAYLIGKSYGSYLQEKYHHNKCVLSWDNRLSSPSLSSKLMEGILSTGCNVICYGMTTTPMNYYARYINQLPGIMVTASHNPKDDNGFKFSFDGMINARGEMITDFRDYTLKEVFLSGNGIVENRDITDKYIEYLKYSIKFGKNKRKIIIDCGNGVTSTIARKVFSNVFCDFEIINEENDGNFPNHHPDPAVLKNLEQLQKKVIEEKADLGIAYDGDGDRLGVVMENGEAMPIEHYMILMIKDMFNDVKNKTFLYDVKCSKCIDDVVKKLGGNTICYRSGASYTEYKTHEEDLPFGAEYSGHVYFRDRDADCCSAIYASLRLLEVLSKTSDKLSDLCKDIPRYCRTEELKFPSDDEKKFVVANQIKQYAIEKRYPFIDIDGVRIIFTNGWVLIRASNTGNNITFRAEAETMNELEILKNTFIPLIEKYNK